MAKPHPAQELFAYQNAPILARRECSIVAGFVMLAYVAALGTIVDNQHGGQVASALRGGLGELVALMREAAPAAEEAPFAADPYVGSHDAIGDYVARRYGVSAQMAIDIVSKAYAVARDTKLDPMLILAVIAVESGFDPGAESSMGAKGLMQVIPRYHLDKFAPWGGEEVAFELEANIVIGAQILKDYLRRAGDLGDALRMYVGASSDKNALGFAAKVMTERERFRYVLRRHQNGAGLVEPGGATTLRAPT